MKSFSATTSSQIRQERGAPTSIGLQVACYTMHSLALMVETGLIPLFNLRFSEAKKKWSSGARNLFVPEGNEFEWLKKTLESSKRVSAYVEYDSPREKRSTTQRNVNLTLTIQVTKDDVNEVWISFTNDGEICGLKINGSDI